MEFGNYLRCVRGAYCRIFVVLTDAGVDQAEQLSQTGKRLDGNGSRAAGDQPADVAGASGRDSTDPWPCGFSDQEDWYTTADEPHRQGKLPPHIRLGVAG
mmetsp:Transcript_33876/g.52775  ORF Transcript_33876/g.52775 Transcript_33876/m.52775 type:complete len:100 (+) Transcript_33876:3124-3423(+)